MVKQVVAEGGEHENKAPLVQVPHSVQLAMMVMVAVIMVRGTTTTSIISNLMKSPVCVLARFIPSVPEGRVVVGCRHLVVGYCHNSGHDLVPGRGGHGNGFGCGCGCGHCLKFLNYLICSHAGYNQPVSCRPMTEKPKPERLRRYWVLAQTLL